MMILKKFNKKFPQFFDYYLDYRLSTKIKNDYLPNNFIFFKTSEDILDWGVEYKKYFEFLKKKYDSASFFNNRELLPYGVFNWYAGNFSKNINDYLRSDINETEHFIMKRIDVLNEEFNKNETKIKENIIVVRRISNKHLNKKLKIGTIIKDKGFLSTSIDLSFRKNNDSNYSPLNNETLIFIKVFKQTNAIYLESISKREEFELLLQNGIELQIEEKFKFLNNQILFTSIKV
jgi:hypothetical protein